MITTKYPIGFWNYTKTGDLTPDAVKDWAELGMTMANSPEYWEGCDKNAMLAILDECEKYGSASLSATTVPAGAVLPLILRHMRPSSVLHMKTSVIIPLSSASMSAMSRGARRPLQTASWHTRFSLKSHPS